MRKQLLVMLCFLVVMASPCLALEITGDAALGAYSKYLWRGFDLSENEPVLQGSVNLNLGGFTLGVWSNMQLENGNNANTGIDNLGDGEITETDFNLTYTFSPVEPVAITVGNYHYTYNVPGSDNELLAGISLDVPLSPKFTAYFAWDVEDDEGMDGLYYTLDVIHEFTLSQNITVGMAGLVGYNQESPLVGDYSALHDFEATVMANYALVQDLSLGFSLLYAAPLSNEAEAAGVDSEWVGGLALSVTF
jgi:uncharacterized protein (TIGR02001 family)